MSKYLRPETLFGTKFESYLNQKFLQPKQNKPNKANKFHNFISSEQQSECDLEALAEKRKEKYIKNMAKRGEFLNE